MKGKRPPVWPFGKSSKVRFCQMPIYDEKKSLKLGREMFKMTDVIYIYIPATKYLPSSTITENATPRWRKRFPQEWAAYKRRLERKGAK